MIINEKLIGLIRQAKQEAKDIADKRQYYDVIEYNQCFEDHTHRILAELIVRECADIAEKWYSDYPSDDRVLSDAVKEHFGVKE